MIRSFWIIASPAQCQVLQPLRPRCSMRLVTLYGSYTGPRIMESLGEER